MHRLVRICLQNWYLVDALDIDVKGSVALIGPTGAGKSSVQDAIQTIVTGNNANRLELNASASGRSRRSVRDYCLGYVGDPAEGAQPRRERCETVLAMVFADETGTPVTVGVALEARMDEPREETVSRFMVPGYAYSVSDHQRRLPDGRIVLSPWKDIRDSLAKAAPKFSEHKTSAERFTAAFLSEMRGEGAAQPNVRHFLRAFSNAVSFKPVFDPTRFVRELVLEPDPLDVARVRQSIATWRSLVAALDELEARYRRAARIEARTVEWARLAAGAAGERLAAATLSAKKSIRDAAGLAVKVAEAEQALAREKKVLQDRRGWVRSFDEDLATRRALVGAGDAASRLRQIQAEEAVARRAEADAAQTLKEYSSAIRSAAACAEVLKDRIPSAFSAPLAKVAALRNPAETAETATSVPEWAGPALAAMARAEALAGLVEDKSDDLLADVRVGESEIQRLEADLERTRAGGSPLSGATSRLVRELGRKGIDALAVCDVAEVSDASWQAVIEAILGRAREALVVEPSRVAEAFDVMWRDRDAFDGCILVDSRRTDPEVRPRAGSLAELVTSSDPHALSFVRQRLGSQMRADSPADLARFERAVTRDGRSVSGLALSVRRDVRDLMLGRRSRNEAAATLEAALEARRNRLAALRDEARRMRECARLIPGIVKACEGLKDSAPAAPNALAEARSRLASLERAKRSASEEVGPALLAEIAELEAERALYANEIAEEIEPAVERLQATASQARAAADASRSQARSAVGLLRKAWGIVGSGDVGKAAAVDADCASSLREPLRVARELSGGSAKEVAHAAAESMRRADRLEAEARRAQSGSAREIAEYLAAFRVEGPGDDAFGLGSVLPWAVEERKRLENNELRRYRQRCAKAESEVRRILREDLLTRLAERLAKVHVRLDALNARLARHRFTGQTYSFECQVDPRYAAVHELVRAVGSSNEEAEAALSKDDPRTAGALTEIQALIDGEADAEALADYRNYFSFELAMRSPDGQRTTMSSRAVRGSGGEAQAPFYVAMAASLAAAYYPGQNGPAPKGCGLALFDEAFNKLDVRNTLALLRFFEDMGLQLMIAAPEDKRVTFTEVVDTIVTVLKAPDGRSVFIDSEFPGPLAREALAAGNPDHGGPVAAPAA